MRRHLALLLALALVVGALGAPALAGKKKKKKKPQPVETTLYFHGEETFGEMESYSVIADAYLPMDPNEPEGSDTKSKQITNAVVTPNVDCAGNTLFPVWVGELSGKVSGDVTVTFTTIGTPGQVDVRIWPDVASLLCNSSTTGSSDYPEPAGSVVVDLPAGQGEVEAVIEDVDFAASSMLMVQITPVRVPPFVSRVQYDSTDAVSKIEFMCLPQKRAKACAN